MSVLILIMFLMAALTLVFGLLNAFLWLTPWWASANMVLAYVMFTLIWSKEQEAEKEKLVQRIQELEALLD